MYVSSIRLEIGSLLGVYACLLWVVYLYSIYLAYSFTACLDCWLGL